MSLNHYQVLYPVGKGQYGQVFKAVRKVDDLPVAIKVIAKKLNERVSPPSLRKKEWLILKLVSWGK